MTRCPELSTEKKHGELLELDLYSLDALPIPKNIMSKHRVKIQLLYTLSYSYLQATKILTVHTD